MKLNYGETMCWSNNTFQKDGAAHGSAANLNTSTTVHVSAKFSYWYIQDLMSNLLKESLISHCLFHMGFNYCRIYVWMTSSSRSDVDSFRANASATCGVTSAATEVSPSCSCSQCAVWQINRVTTHFCSAHDSRSSLHLRDFLFSIPITSQADVWFRL